MSTFKANDYAYSEEFQVRSSKGEDLKAQGVELFPLGDKVPTALSKVVRGIDVEALLDFEAAQSGASEEVIVAGRVVLHRCMGKNIFLTLQHEGARIQILSNRDVTKLTRQHAPNAELLTDHKCIEKKIDLGDHVIVRGNLFKTQKGEATVFAKEFTLAAKSFLPLPDKHAGLKDPELRYRKRHLDLISHPEVMETFLLRSKILRAIRKFFEKEEFLEVETPVLTQSYGGANAHPFTTNLRALDQEMFMRIALELPLKQLIVGGFDRVFEIGKNFRNEGIDRTHNPEFSMLECYAAYWDYNDMMRLTEELFDTVAREVLGTTIIGEKEDPDQVMRTIDVKAPWRRMTMKEAIKQYAKIDPDQMSEEEMRQLLLDKTTLERDRIKRAPRGMLIAFLFEEFAEGYLIEPTHIVDHPLETTPLCSPHRNAKERSEGLIERFESFIGGCEMCNAYSELNDPILQRKLLEEQDRLLHEEGDDEAAPFDMHFCEAVAQGMPPTGGLGIGLDRLVMLLTKQTTIREVLFFPVLRREES